MNFTEDNRPFRAMNMDDSDLAINYNENGQAQPFQDYRYAKNIRTAINQANKGRALTNVLSNLEITTYILPYSGGIWPAGTNRCVGAYEDKAGGTIIFFVWNSNGNNQILQYYRNQTDPNNPYGVVQQVMMYNGSLYGEKGWGWTRNTRITSINLVYGQPTEGTNIPGNLLYWCDPVPHMIDITLANICNKLKSWTFYPGATFNSFTNQGNFTFQLFDYNATLLLTVNIITPIFNDPNLTPAENNFNGLTYVAGQINSLYGQYVTAEACDCSLTITENNRDFAKESLLYVYSGIPLRVYATNWYGDLLLDRYFDRCMWQPLNSPQGTYKQDTNYLPNYVQKKVFQFRLLYTYRCGSPSAPGVWSQIPINNLTCDGTDNPELNYVDVNFNDSLLIDTSALVIFNQVWFIARELNTGKDKVVIQLNPCDFLDYDGTNWFCHYKFYNNIISTPLDDVTAAQIFDDVPLESGAELETQNRMLEGNVLTGYNPPECPIASYEIDFAQPPQVKLHAISGNIRVATYGLDNDQRNGTNFYFSDFYPNNHKYPFYQFPLLDIRGGIFHDTSRTDTSPGGNFAFFGGAKFSPGGVFGIRDGMETRFDQRIPEAGWPVYAAGTQYMTVSKQKNVGLATDSNGAFDTATDADRAALGTFYDVANGNDVYSTFQLLVPDGTYVLRLASHWCSFGDKLNRGFCYNLNNGTSYQKTSTNVWGVYDANGNWLPQREIVVTVNGGDIFIGDFLIADLSPPVDATIDGSDNTDRWQGFNCYLVDSNGATDINSTAYLGEVVEKTTVGYEGMTSTNGLTFNSVALTDHNGYFFGIGGLNGNLRVRMREWQVGQSPSFNTLIGDTTLIYTGTLADYYNKTLVPFDFNNAGSGIPYGYNLIVGLVTTGTPIARAQCSTLIEGKVVDQSNKPITNATIIYYNGRVDSTDSNGNYSMIAWGDMITANLGLFPGGSLPPLSDENRVVDSLLFSIPIFCIPSYPNGQIVPTLNIQPISLTGYNPSNPFLVPDFIINEGNDPAQKARKRGGQYVDVIRLYDNAGRLCSCAKLYDLYMPFETEDLHKYLPAQYPVQGTYIQGKPTIRWSLNASFKPPQWAAYYQFMRSKNLIYGRYLQWIANEVIYLSAIATVSTPEIKTSFNNGDAVALKISISNITSYAAENPNSQVGYTFQTGDRLRLIADRRLNYYTTIYDFEITGYDDTTQSIIIKYVAIPNEILSGSLLEIFNPLSLASTDEQVYYEVGEVYKCTLPGDVNNDFSVRSGTFTNGDTYWRGRLINVTDDTTKYAATYPVIIEDAAISDFYPSTAQDIGRPGTIDPSFVQLLRPTALVASGEYLPGTAVNGLSTFNPADTAALEAEIDRRYGQIQRLFYEMNVLQVICSSKNVGAPIDRDVLYQGQANSGVVSISGDFFNTKNFYIHAKNLGTDFPGSCCTNSGLLFGLNNYLANAWRWQGATESVISDMKMITFFKQLQQDGILDAVSIYDRYYEEYVLTYWRKYLFNARPVFTIGRVDASYSFDMPKQSGPTNPFYGRVGEPPEVNTEIKLELVVNGVTYDTTGIVASVQLHDSTYTIGVTVDLDSANTLNTLLAANPNLLAQFTYGLPETILWFEGTDIMKQIGAAQVWRGFLDWTPEWWCNVGSDMLSFKDGRPWISTGQNTTPNTQRNTFFGTRYNSRITPVFNGVGEKHNIINKVWNALTLWMTQGLQVGGGNKGSNSFFSDPSVGQGITNTYGQLSRLKAANWVFDENHWSTEFLRDMNDLSIPLDPNSINPYGMRVINGMVLRSEALTVELINDYPNEIVLYSAKGNYTLSAGPLR